MSEGGAILAALARLEAGQMETHGVVTGLSAEMAGFRAGVLDTVTGLRAEMAGFGAGLMEELGATRGAIMDRMSRLQDSLTAIRDDIGVNMGAADAVKRANENTRELVRLQGEQLAVMWRQLKALEARLRDITGDP